MSKSQASQLYYGWKIVIALLVMLTFTSGLSFYNHAIYLNALAENPNFTVQSASIAVSIFFLSGGITGLWVAKWVQDYDPRYCITAGAILSCIALFALAYVNSLWQLYAAYAVFGMGFSASSLIPATTLVTRWFHRRRAMALSIASTGLSLGGVILTPLSALLVESMGFEVAAPVLGVVFLLGVIPVSWLWLRPSPESMGLRADGDTSELVAEREDTSESGVGQAAINANRGGDVSQTQAQPAATAGLDGVTFKEARGGRFFWGISVGYIFLMMAQVGGIAHQYGLAREQLSESQTAIAVAILPVASIVGRLIGGWLIGQMSIRAFAMAMMILQAVSLSVLSSGYSVTTLCIGLALFGTSVGNLLMLQPLLIAEAFGVKEYAKIFSIANLMSSWGTAAGPAVLGLVFAANQNLYGLSYGVAAMAGGIGFLCFVFGGKLKQA